MHATKDDFAFLGEPTGLNRPIFPLNFTAVSIQIKIHTNSPTILSKMQFSIKVSSATATVELN